MNKAVFNWSGGKDSALALYYVLQQNQFEVTSLLTTINSKYNRISMHGVRKELLHEQSNSIGIPVKEIVLPEMPSMSDYNNIMKKTMLELKESGVEYSIFGDIFLEDLKKYREEKLKEVGIKPLFPLWKRNTSELIREFIDLGFKTIVVCANSQLGTDFTGRVIDNDFLRDLPKGIDPCGENGEFHTFVFDGPIFKAPVKFEIGEKISRDFPVPKEDEDSCGTNNESATFYYCDLIPL